MILVDTNVLIYALTGDHALRAPCERIALAIGDGQLEATTSALVIQEFVHVYSRRRSRAEASARAADWVDLLAPLVEIETEAVREALAWFADTELDATDAFLAAAVHLTDGTQLLSANKDFEVLDELWVTPTDLAVTLGG